jgi:hypothetical protein
MHASRSFLQATRLMRGFSTAVKQTKMAAARKLARENKKLVSVGGTIILSASAIAGITTYVGGWKSEVAMLEEKLVAMKEAQTAFVKKEDFAKVEAAYVKKEDFAKVEAAYVKKEDFAKVEATFASKEDLAKLTMSVSKMETEVQNLLQSARLEGEKAALRVWKEKKASVAKQLPVD